MTFGIKVDSLFTEHFITALCEHGVREQITLPRSVIDPFLGFMGEERATKG